MQKVELAVPKKHHVKFIGVGGSLAQQFRSIGVKVACPAKDSPSRIISFEFTPDKAQQCQQAIQQVLGHPIQNGALLILDLNIPNNKYGKIIGRGGSVLKQIEAEFYCSIKVPRRNESGNVQVEVHECNLDRVMQKLQQQVGVPVQKNVLDRQMAGAGGAASGGGGGGGANMPTVGMRVAAVTDQAGTQQGTVTQPFNPSTNTVKIRFDCNGQEFDVPITVLRKLPGGNAGGGGIGAGGGATPGLQMGARVVAKTDQAGNQPGTIVGPQTGNVIKVRMDIDPSNSYDIPINLLSPHPNQQQSSTGGTGFGGTSSSSSLSMPTMARSSSGFNSKPDYQQIRANQQFSNVKDYFKHMVRQGAQQRGRQVPDHWINTKAGELTMNLKKKNGFSKETFWQNSQGWFQKQLDKVLVQAQGGGSNHVHFGGTTVMGQNRQNQSSFGSSSSNFGSSSFGGNNQQSHDQAKNYFMMMIRNGARQRGKNVQDHWVSTKAGELAMSLKKKGGSKESFWGNSQKWFNKQLANVGGGGGGRRRKKW